MCNQLSQQQLAAYFDGTAPAWVARHVVRCPECRAQLARWGRAHDRLSRRAAGPGCPSAMTLGEYYLDTLGLEESLDVWRHLQGCAACRDRLADTGGFVDGRRDRQAILYPALVQQGGYAPAALRSGQPAPVSDMTFKIHEAEINVTIRPIPVTTDQHAITGLVTGIGLADGARVELLDGDDGRPIAAHTVDPMGGFVFAPVGRGTVTIVLRGAQMDYVLRGITVG